MDTIWIPAAHLLFCSQKGRANRAKRASQKSNGLKDALFFKKFNNFLIEINTIDNMFSMIYNVV